MGSILRASLFASGELSISLTAHPALAREITGRC